MERTRMSNRSRDVEHKTLGLMNRRRWGYVLAVTVVTIAILLGARRSVPVQSEANEPGRPVSVQSEPKDPVPAQPAGLELGRSVEGRPIAAWRWNEDNGPPILIFSGIHGDERSAIELARRMEKRWIADPSLLGGHHVFFIPIVNPDGFEADTRKNARGVDLNRNFPGGWVNSAPRDADHGGTIRSPSRRRSCCIDWWRKKLRSAFWRCTRAERVAG